MQMASEKVIRQQDLNSLAKKLKAFSVGLPAQEQGVLEWMLANARNTGELSDSGLEDASGGGDSVGWTHTFNSTE
jgi:hypothetical protein